MITISGTRWGTIEIEENAVITLEQGLIGFPNEKRFVLIQGKSAPIAFLQSIATPHIALPCVDAGALGDQYPRENPAALVREANIGGSKPVMLVTLAIHPDNSLCANLLAPIVIDAESRIGAQIVLDPRNYTTMEPVTFSASAPPPPNAQPRAATNSHANV